MFKTQTSLTHFMLLVSFYTSLKHQKTFIETEQWREMGQRASSQNVQKQPGEVFFEKRYSEKFCNIHRKTSVLESLFHKVAALKACSFNKKRIQHRCFPVNIAKFLRAPILKNICERLLLSVAFISLG